MKTPQQTELPMDLPTPARQGRQFHSIRLFTDHTVAARFWLGAFLVSQLVFVTRCLLPDRRDYVTALDGAETVVRSPLLRFAEARRVHVKEARRATHAFLNRSPEGFDDPDLLEDMFLANAFEKARQNLTVEAEERAAKRLHQKAEIEATEILKTSEEGFLVEVTGQLVRAGVFQSRSFAETVPFKLSMRLLRNPDLTKNSRYLTAVSEFRYETP